MADVSSISAINNVLLIESEGRKRIESCRQQAEQLIQDGRTKALLISKRIDGHISTVHKRSDMGIEKRLAELKLEMQLLSIQPQLEEKDYNQLNSAIAILVEEMVGDSQ